MEELSLLERLEEYTHKDPHAAILYDETHIKGITYGIQSEEELQGVFGRLLPIYAFNTILNAAVSGETDGPVYAHIPEMVQEAIIPPEQVIRQGLSELS